ncbi:hypothetical protein OM169_23015 [Escherichia albertii]|uniref:hypothetical protein n=1 Tax=Escherichia albertii TaxID=208962 RepID=UPI001374F8F3|nr:hypothetical protein [Escherichia albertii]MCZ8677566.1 hypothetical protein [Escherichia albertii]
MIIQIIRSMKNQVVCTKTAIVSGLSLAKTFNCPLIISTNSFAQALSSGCLRVAIGETNFFKLRKNRCFKSGSTEIHLKTHKWVHDNIQDLPVVLVSLWPGEKIIKKIASDALNLRAIVATESIPEELEMWRNRVHGNLLNI